MRLASASLACIGVVVLLVQPAGAGTPVTPRAPPTAAVALPWAAWFEKNTMVSDKKTYVHMLWDANAVRGQFEVRSKRAFVAEAARQLTILRYPRGASSDAIRVDIVFVAQRDEYCNPKWDTLQRIAHLEFSRKRIGQAPPGPELERAFDKFEVFP